MLYWSIFQTTCAPLKLRLLFSQSSESRVGDLRDLKALCPSITLILCQYMIFLINLFLSQKSECPHSRSNLSSIDSSILCTGHSTWGAEAGSTAHRETVPPLWRPCSREGQAGKCTMIQQNITVQIRVPGRSSMERWGRREPQWITRSDRSLLSKMLGTGAGGGGRAGLCLLEDVL